MASHQEDIGNIASKLLLSSDARIAEAAKRVFSSSTLPAAAVSLSALSAAPSAASASTLFDDRSIHAPGVDQADVSFMAGGLPLHCGAEHTADINPGAGEYEASNDDLAEDKEGSEKKPSSTERLKRSNRMHARKTRQRKKEHMQKLQNRADALKLEQTRLKQAINEKNTASILVGLFQSEGDSAESTAGNTTIDPKVEVLMKRSTEDIPDASKIPELPALILPGQHNGKRKSMDEEGDIEPESTSMPDDPQEDGIDYALLGKDRSACTPAELDQIRRERNRMHAKRTRDRKRIFMEEMEVMIKQLEDENSLLQEHVNKLNANQPSSAEEVGAALVPFPQMITPPLAPLSAPSLLAAPSSLAATANHDKPCESNENEPPQTKGDFLNQIESLLAAAGSFQKKGAECEINAISCAESDVTASTNRSDHNSFCEEEDDEHCHQLSGSHPNKRQRASDLPTSVPTSITTTNISL
ncbi:hypothetical protein ACHAXR_009297 [Thalassiosira sp. AJA248-18]